MFLDAIYLMYCIAIGTLGIFFASQTRQEYQVLFQCGTVLAIIATYLIFKTHRNTKVFFLFLTGGICLLASISITKLPLLATQLSGGFFLITGFVNFTYYLRRI